jgi:arylsulfatase A-like enzyme
MTATRRSLILITIDCLRADHVGWLGYNLPTTPFLDSLAAESTTYSNAIVGGAPTYYSFPAIMASRYPLAFGRDVIGLCQGEPTIASTLKDFGYSTAAFLSTNPYLSHRFGYSQGFDEFHDFQDFVAYPTEIHATAESASPLRRVNQALRKASSAFAATTRAYDELYFQYCQRMTASKATSFDRLRRFPSADLIVDEARTWLASNKDRPFFLWLHFMDAHAPYYPCEQAIELMGGSPDPRHAQYLNEYWKRSDLEASRLQQHREEVVALCDAGVRWVDTQIARLTSSLHELDLWDDCAMAVTADHGEEFLDHGGRFHSPSQTGEEVVRVPLLLRVPESRLPVSIHNPFSLIDLAPMLLDTVGVPSPSSFRGVHPLTESQPSSNPVVIESVAACTNPMWRESRLNSRVLVVREQRYKLVLDFGTPNAHLYDLAANPHEKSPLSTDAEKVVRKRLLESARQHIASSVNSRDQRVAMSAHVRDLRLEWANPNRYSPA